MDKLARKLGKKLPQQDVDIEFNGSDSAGRQNGNIKVMIVDDDEDLLKLYDMQISGWQSPKADVYLTSDGYDALLQIGTHKPDIIITELKMPGIDGSHMISAIQKHPDNSQTRIVVVTGLNKDDIEQNYQLPDSVLVEEKPISFARIQRLITEQSERSSELN